ncbi:hypothetical protein [Marinitenerispora sediminis]|uniref:Uncharacterized protein n=1 Tax=Marinitenerispora sediminis TaxID=1931232 RepID=A0A368SYE1_9ACTN|nr:hypothetical protein [Marinitenerispora sediminis]RCV47880.1 hypothetical protein DEF28_25105 [Marinitenerispora sediminis]RCV49108.1 hypothetical protein DEF24_25545 [Marinitenerispora sediminis]RCV52138.1 hypothetical protein DEF23_19300 [Marinitenerispora sediminis]
MAVGYISWQAENGESQTVENPENGREYVFSGRGRLFNGTDTAMTVRIPGQRPSSEPEDASARGNLLGRGRNLQVEDGASVRFEG